MANASAARIAYILALVGGILLVIFGLLSLIGYSVVYFGPFFYVGTGVEMVEAHKNGRPQIFSKGKALLRASTGRANLL